MRHVMLVMFLVTSGVIFYAVGEFAQRVLGVERFPERTLSYSVAKLSEPKTREFASQYVVPVLIPLDLIVMVLLGGSMAVASLFWARSAGVPAEAVWLVLLLPVGYVAADLAEDSLLVLMLTDPGSITDSLAGVLKNFTILKLGCIFAAGAQTLGLGVLAAGKAILPSM